ncbi:MAG: hypothetical protein V2A34_07630 [Lentisphaerota bacterium]
MSDSSRIVFPMRIEASDLFDVIYRQSARWRSQLDNTDKSRAVFDAAKPIPSVLHPRAASSSSGRHVNILA